MATSSSSMNAASFCKREPIEGTLPCLPQPSPFLAKYTKVCLIKADTKDLNAVSLGHKRQISFGPGFYRKYRWLPHSDLGPGQMCLCMLSRTHRLARPALRTAEEMALMAVNIELSSCVSSPVPLACRPFSIT